MDWIGYLALAFIIWVFLVAGISSFTSYRNRRRDGTRGED
jgi:hypothetical protein